MSESPFPFQRLCTRPLVLLPTRVWRTYSGGQMLGLWRGYNEPDGSMPEDWAGSTTRAVNASHPGGPDEGLSRIDGAQAGLADNPLLLDLINACPEGMLGAAHVRQWGAQTALLVKALDAAERLAIQAHPDRASARRYFQSAFGKTEAWYVLAARPDVSPAPAVLLGFRENMTRARWRNLFETQDIQGMQQALHRIEVQPGDVLLIEGGVPHAIGEGCFLIEIQEPTDYTLRVERTTPRGLALPDAACHQGAGFEAMLSMFHYDFLTREETLARWRMTPRALSSCAEGELDELIGEGQTPCFTLLRLHVHGRMPAPVTGRFQIAVAVSGSGTLHAGENAVAVRQGTSLFLPASMQHAVWEAQDMTVLLCRPPEKAPEAVQP